MSDSTENTRSPGNAGWGLGTKILLGILGLIAVIAVIAVVTLTVAVVESQTGTSFPYITTYRVSLPDGEPVTIGSTRILALTMPDGVDVAVDGNKEKLTVGQERIINPRYARISALGVPLMDTDFQITLRYLGASGNNALFDMTVRTSKQVPEMVVRKLLPPSMNAQPV
ncbi:MAG: hypothetical protein Q8R70_11845 [Methanoregula sp.]|nr:hypothetical protein [Methanoregula sp.]